MLRSAGYHIKSSRDRKVQKAYKFPDAGLLMSTPIVRKKLKVKG